MKKSLLIVAMLLSFCAFAQEPPKYVREGNTIVQVEQPDQLTPYIYKIIKDDIVEEYPIWITKNGSCYIKRVSKKTGNEYKQYLPKDLSQALAKEFRSNQ